MPQKIVYTLTDEAPMLATHSLLPIFRAYTAPAGIEVELRDISLAGRILAAFPEYLQEDQRVCDDLLVLSQLTQDPQANMIKLPNISASLPQLKAAIAELQQQGYPLPNYPDEAQTPQEKEIQTRYDKIKGSAVNPVLREGNSDRRAPRAVKRYAQMHPHRMGAWSPESKTCVASMSQGDFYGSEQSLTLTQQDELKIVFVSAQGERILCKEGLKIQAGDIVDCCAMNMRELKAYVQREKERAREQNLLLSLHLKATMMKVSDPVIFGAVVEEFYGEIFEKYGKVFKELGVDVTNGLGDLLAKIQGHALQGEIEQAIQNVYAKSPDLAMVDSDQGITNLHVPNHVIIDASMPAMIRNSGKMWNAQGELQDTLALIPDRSYAGVYQETIAFCKEHGAFDPRTMGSVPNVGLMAQKAEEYGSHDKTFLAPESGVFQIEDREGHVLMTQTVEAGDIFRGCLSRDAAIQDWIKLAVQRARLSETPAVFWLDTQRAHDVQLMEKVRQYLPLHETSGLDIQILSPIQATRLSLQRAQKGLDTISVTGNVLRDYLTDLFPILELGTSAKMLSIVPLMAGGGLFETGAGGSAPKHVQQFVAENYLRWDSLGEFLAFAVALEHLSQTCGNSQAAVLAETLDEATGKVLEYDRSPARKLGALDNRGSHFYLALYWAQALVQQEQDLELQQRFKAVAEVLESQEQAIIAELNGAQGVSVSLGGYYHPDSVRLTEWMCPSSLFNQALALLADS